MHFKTTNNTDVIVSCFCAGDISMSSAKKLKPFFKLIIPHRVQVSKSKMRKILLSLLINKN